MGGFVIATSDCHDVPVRGSHGPQTTWRRIGLLVFGVVAFLLLSMGGAILAAPVTLPLMFTASRRHPTRRFRLAGAILGGLTMAEVAWAITYLALEEAKPWIWLVPLAAATATIVAFAAESSPRRRVLPAG